MKLKLVELRSEMSDNELDSLIKRFAQGEEIDIDDRQLTQLQSRCNNFLHFPDLFRSKILGNVFKDDKYITACVTLIHKIEAHLFPKE